MMLFHVVLSFIALLVPSLCSPTATDNEYDYTIVGSGPGGAPLAVNLAKAGHLILLLEAGDDQTSDIRMHIVSFKFTPPMKIEKNHYLPRGTPGHGFDGYLDINGNNGTVWEGQPDMLQVFRSMVSMTGGDSADVVEMVQRDINTVDPNRDVNQGLYGLPRQPDLGPIYADPTDTPEINFDVFSDEKGAGVDLGAMADAAAWARRVYCWGRVRWVPKGMSWLFWTPSFWVRGVQGLRVVDGSVFPFSPRAFPVVATFLISEKAAEDILGKA
ncbi:hypothetical protein QBC47DRAFT_355297 [Echria macrotheca]|uniref:Glucose-methanol-choline oxidoreductase C-terminal domain-containing protein n=1 Tax=Echria macrotheca TaxID=438768 RepID=A0AAJ0FFN1_9PEZI|nr:hypothetical protein QBC47DRAFT_355297 [Echria macrotheca]